MRTIRPEGAEGPPRREADEETNEEGKDLPVQRNGGNQAGGEEKDRAEEGTETAERGDKRRGAEEARGPGEAPIIPMKARRVREQPIAEDCEDREEDGNGFLGLKEAAHRKGL